MTLKPNFATITKKEIRTYVLKHRENEQALSAYLDRLHSENPNPRTYGTEENVAEAIEEYIKQRKL